MAPGRFAASSGGDGADLCEGNRRGWEINSPSAVAHAPMRSWSGNAAETKGYRMISSDQHRPTPTDAAPRILEYLGNALVGECGGEAGAPCKKNWMWMQVRTRSLINIDIGKSSSTGSESLPDEAHET